MKLKKCLKSNRVRKNLLPALKNERLRMIKMIAGSGFGQKTRP